MLMLLHLTAAFDAIDHEDFRGVWSPWQRWMELPLSYFFGTASASCLQRQTDGQTSPERILFSRDKLGEVISFTGATFPDTDSFLRSLKTQALTQLFIQAAGYSCTAHRLKILFVVKKLGTVAG